MTNFIDLLPEIQPYCPGVPEPLVVTAVRRAVRYLCHETDLLTIESDPLLDITANESTFSIGDPAGTEIVRVLEVFVNDDQLTHRSEQQLDRDAIGPSAFHLGNSSLAITTTKIRFETVPWRTETGWPPQFWYQPRPRCVRLVPIPTQGGTAIMKVVVSVKPSLTATSIDDYFIDNWYETIVEGALAYLLALPKKGWTDVRQGVARSKDFRDAVAAIENEASSGFHRNDQAVGHVRSHP